MRGNQKVRVKTDELLKAVEARRAQLVANHERDVASYGKREDTYRKALVKALRERADKIEAGGPLPERVYDGSIRVKVNATPPSKPTLALVKIDRTIRTLGMAADEAIAISADVYAEYLG